MGQHLTLDKGKTYSKQLLLQYYSETHKNEFYRTGISVGYRPSHAYTYKKEKIDLKNINHHENLKLEIIVQQNTKKIINPTEYPFSCVGYLSIKFNSGVIGATGCLIGKNLIITAAKNIYNKKLKQFAKDIWFMPALIGDIGGAYSVKSTFYIPKKYIHQDKQEEDLFNFAVLQTEEELIGLSHGYLGINVDYKPTEKTTLLGYSSQSGTELKCFLRQTPIQKLICKDGFLSYKEQMFSTECGSPIIYSNGIYSHIVGIHLSSTKGISYGIHFDDRIRKTINSWIYQVSGQLNLWDKGINPGQIELINAMPWHNMTILRLGKNNLGNDGLKLLTHRDWPNLRQLYLRQNKISELEWKGKALVSLQQLYLTSNLIKKTKNLEDLQFLTLLDISGNVLESFDNICQLRQLQVLYLGYNKLTKISGSIKQLERLRQLCLQYNKITILPQQLLQLKKIEIIKIQQNKLEKVKNQVIIKALNEKNVELIQEIVGQ